MALTKEQAIERAFDTCNLLGGESLDIYAVLYRYKALRDLPENELNEIYEQIAERLGF